MKTKVEELPESRVRLEVEVPEADVRHAFEHAASDLAGSLRLPGFRKGKAPLPVVIARVGREAVWEEALRSHLESWFWSAAASSGIQPVASPEMEFGALPDDGGPFSFTATVAVMPKPEVADWTTLEVPAPEAEVPPEAVDAELERIRELAAELVPADRAAQPGDVVVLDLTGEDVPHQLDYVAEVGAGRLVEEIDAALPGMSAGDEKTVELRTNEGGVATVTVKVNEVKEKILPPLDDELARAATEFDTLAELRADVERTLGEELAEELEIRFRESAVDALVEASDVEVTGPLRERRTAELWVGLLRSLERRGVSAEAYLAMTGQSQEEVLGRLQAEADRSLKRDLVLDAVADKLGLEVSDAEIDELVREQAGEGDDDPAEVTRRLREAGAYDKLRGDLRLKKALDEIVAAVKPIPVALAHAREKIWTPDKEKDAHDTKIWTPGQKEANPT